MLMLTRKPGESIVIGNNIRVTVLAASSSSIKLGFEAPPDVSIYREELHRQIVDANRAALGEVVDLDSGSKDE